MVNIGHIDMRSFLATQLYSETTGTLGRIVIGGIISPVTRLVSVDPSSDNKVLVGTG